MHHLRNYAGVMLPCTVDVPGEALRSILKVTPRCGMHSPDAHEIHCVGKELLVR